jgi:hypothetical protein
MTFRYADFCSTELCRSPTSGNALYGRLAGSLGQFARSRSRARELQRIPVFASRVARPALIGFRLPSPPVRCDRKPFKSLSQAGTA